MVFSQNTQQRMKSTILFIYTALRTMFATLLTVFVYQVCSNSNSSDNDCTLTDIFAGLTKFSIFALAMNFVTLAMFVGFYILEYHREHKYIKYLDVDENISANNIKIEIQAYSKIKKKLGRLDLHYRNYSIAMIVVNILNIIVSSIAIYNHYGGYKSAIGLLSEAFLIVDKLYNSVVIAYKSVKESLPYSAYMKEYIIFNTIDQKYKNKKYLSDGINVDFNCVNDMV